MSYDSADYYTAYEEVKLKLSEADFAWLSTAGFEKMGLKGLKVDNYNVELVESTLKVLGDLHDYDYVKDYVRFVGGWLISGNSIATYIRLFEYMDIDS